MTAATIFKRLQSLQSPEPLLTGEIVADLGGGLVRVRQPGGGLQEPRNPLGLAVGQWVFFQDRVIRSQAPNLPEGRIEI